MKLTASPEFQAVHLLPLISGYSETEFLKTFGNVSLIEIYKVNYLLAR